MEYIRRWMERFVIPSIYDNLLAQTLNLCLVVTSYESSLNEGAKLKRKEAQQVTTSCDLTSELKSRCGAGHVFGPLPCLFITNMAGTCTNGKNTAKLNVKMILLLTI